MFRISFLATALSAVALVFQAAYADASRLGHTQIMDIAEAAQTVAPGAKVSINPQPLPPRVQHEATSFVASGFSKVGPGANVMINPQPLPPKQQNGARGFQ